MDPQLEICHIEDISLHDRPSFNLLQLLQNSLVLWNTVENLHISSLLALGASSKALRSLLYSTPNVFRHLDLTRVKAARSELGSIDHGGNIWRNFQLDENVTEDDFYGGPLRGIFSSLRKRNILKDVQTLILDGLTVPSDLVAEIILDQSFSVRLLSIREVLHLNEAKLQQALQYAARSSRPEGSPKLQGLYIFGPKDAPSMYRSKPYGKERPSAIMQVDTVPFSGGVMSSQGAQIGAQWNQRSGETLQSEDFDRWYQKRGKIISRPLSDSWAGTLQACRGIISFDAVLCNGPRHSPLTSVDEYLPPAVATYAVEGCNKCQKCPEGFSQLQTSPLEQFPLLAPLPLHSSTVKAAKTPSCSSLGTEKRLLARCYDCLRNRYCEGCHKWWCEDCYRIPPSTGPQNLDSNPVSSNEESVKVHMDLCVEDCLVGEMMSRAGSNGMWG